MTEIVYSPDLVYLFKVHLQYVCLEDAEGTVFKPEKIKLNKETKLYELYINISNLKEQNNEQENFGDNGFSRISTN